MRRLNTKRLRKLELIWKKHPDGIKINDFVKIVLDQITPKNDEEQIELINASI
jgi:hypothetical protein